jgi:hypothetical protein
MSKHKINSIEDAVKFVRQKGYFVHVVYFGGRKFYQVSDCKRAILKNRPNVKGSSWKNSQSHFEDGHHWTNYTPQSFMSFVSSWTSPEPWNSTVKEFRHRNNRAKTKELMNSENYDTLGPKSLAKDENIWNWD